MTNLACWAFALALAAALAAGCNNVSYKDPTTIPSAVTTESTGHFFLAGLVGHADVWADRRASPVFTRSSRSSTSS